MARYFFECTHADKTALSFESHAPRHSRNPYYLTFALAKLLDDRCVRELFAADLQELRDQFEDWKPSSKPLKEVRMKLDPLKVLPRSQKAIDEENERKRKEEEARKTQEAAKVASKASSKNESRSSSKKRAAEEETSGGSSLSEPPKPKKAASFDNEASISGPASDDKGSAPGKPLDKASKL